MESKMKKYMYFALGYITAIMTLLLASCTISPLQADYDTPGYSASYPMFVKIVE